MGTEGEQLVYDYLSRVGDLAQSTPMTSGERARLVMTLRQEIDAKRGAGTPGAVRKVLKGLGSPEEVVKRAAAAAPEVPAGPSVPVQRPVPDEPSVYAPEPARETMEWWRKSSAGAAAPGAGGGPAAGGPADRRPPSGWSASFEPDFLEAGEVDDTEPEGAEAAETGPAPSVEAAPEPEAAPAPERVKARRGLPPFVESLAVLTLAAGGVLGLWYLALVGWFLAYSSRRVSRPVALTAGVWIPVVLAAALGFWVQRTGHPDSATVHSAFALWLRAASLGSAAFLLWRARR